MSYLDLLVIIDPGSARTAQAVIWKGRKKKPTQNPKRFSAGFEKDADNEVFSLYLARDDISTIWSEERRHLLENPAANEACYTSKVVSFSDFWEQTFPRQGWWQTSSVLWHLLHELSWLNWIPFCLLQTALIWEQIGKRGFFSACFKAFPKRITADRKCSLRVKEEKQEWGINAWNLGGEFSSGNGSVRIYRPI